MRRSDEEDFWPDFIDEPNETCIFFGAVKNQATNSNPFYKHEQQ